MTVKRIGKADYILGADVRKLKKDLKGADESVKKSGKTAEKAYSDAATRGAGKLGRAQAGLIKQQATIKQGLLGGVGMAGGLLAFGAITGAVKALVGTLGDAASAAGDLELAMRTVNTITKVSDDELQALTRQVQLLSMETGSKTSGLTQAMYSLVSAGVDVENVMDVLTDSVTLAKGALSTTDEAVSLIASTMNAWRMDVSQSSRVMDIWAKTVANGTTTAGKLAGAISNIAPTAAAAGVGLEEVAAALATMTVGGTQTAKATTQLAAAVRGLMVPNTALRKEQEALNGATFAGIMETEGLIGAFSELARVTGGDMSRISAALGPQEALAAYLQLSAEASGITAKNLEDMYAASSQGGVAAQMMAERLNTLAGAQERFDASLNVMQQTLGSHLLGPLTDIFNGLSDLLGPPDLTNQNALDRLALSINEVDLAAQRLMETNKIAKAVAGAPGGEEDPYRPHKGFGFSQQAYDDRLAKAYANLYSISSEQMTGWAEKFETNLTVVRALVQQAQLKTTEDVEAFVERMDSTLNADTFPEMPEVIENLIGPTEDLDAAAASLEGRLQELNTSALALSQGGVKGLRSDFKDASVQFNKLMKNPKAIEKQIRELDRQEKIWTRRIRAARKKDNDLGEFYGIEERKRIRERNDLLKNSGTELENVTAKLGDVAAAARGIPTDIEIKAVVKLETEGGASDLGKWQAPQRAAGVFGRASGGNTVGGRTYLVGEEGPELWSDSSRGYMLDAAKTSRALSGSAQGVGVNGRIQHEHSISSESAQALRSAGYDERGVADLLHAAAIDADQRYRFGGR